MSAVQAGALEVARGVGEQHAVGREREVAHPGLRGQRRRRASAGRGGAAARRRSGAADPRRARRTGRRACADLLERQHVLARQPEVLVLRHAVVAAQVAAVGDRQPQAAAAAGRACRGRACSEIIASQPAAYNGAAPTPRRRPMRTLRLALGLALADERGVAGAGPWRRRRAAAAAAAQSAGRHAAHHGAQDRGGRRGREAEGLLAADGRSDLQLRRARLPGVRDVELPRDPARRRTASPSRRASPAFRRRSWRRGATASR